MAQPFQVLENVCREFGFSNLLDEIIKIRKVALHPGLLNIAVFGRFKTGKSSFLNHLFGEDLLPTGAIPVTNVITRIRYGKAHHTVVYFLDGHREEISREKLSSFITEKENPNNIKQVDFVELSFPGLKPYSHLQFIDTPGIGSMFAHNTLVSKQWASGTGVAVLAVDPGHPMSEDEVRFLEILRKYTPDVRILLTKTDLYPETALQEVKSFIQEHIMDNMGMILPVFSYSVIENAPAHRKRFIQDVLIPLEASFIQKRDNINDHKVYTLAKECTGYLNVVRAARKKSEQERKNLLQEMLKEQMDMNRIRREIQLIANNYTSSTRISVETQLIPKKEALTLQLKQQLRKAFPDWKGNLFKLSRKFEAWTSESIASALSDIVESECPSFNAIPEQARSHLEKYLGILRNQLHDKIKEILDISLETDRQKIKLKEFPPPDVSVSWAFDSNIDLLWFLFPMFIFKSMVGRYFERHLNLEVEKNLYRLTSLITERINTVIIAMSRETLHRYDMETLTIRNSLEQKPDTDISVARALHEIAALLSH